MRDASRIANQFKLDPVMVLAELDPFNVAVRVAAYQQVQKDQEAASKAAGNKK